MVGAAFSTAALFSGSSSYAQSNRVYVLRDWGFLREGLLNEGLPGGVGGPGLQQIPFCLLVAQVFVQAAVEIQKRRHSVVGDAVNEDPIARRCLHGFREAIEVFDRRLIEVNGD